MLLNYLFSNNKSETQTKNFDYATIQVTNLLFKVTETSKTKVLQL